MTESLLGGLAIGLGSVAYMHIYDGTLFSDMIGALCFCIIMLAIPYYDLDLFIGRPGLMVDRNTNPVESILIYLGNFIGVTWIALILKLIPEYAEKIGQLSNETLTLLHEYTWDTVFIISIFAGMMMYAGLVATYSDKIWGFFMAACFVTVAAKWPLCHLLFFCFWSDSWEYWYLIVPVTLGNIIGSNIWGLLRKHSPRYKHAHLFTPDSSDIVDKFHDFVLRTKNQESNKDSPFDK